ncbi:MAG TPA: hypothetical protein VF571_04855 [Pyrinomonadaceae bacterium]|jgi:hypothetical protein
MKKKQLCGCFFSLISASVVPLAAGKEKFRYLGYEASRHAELLKKNLAIFG